MLASILFAFVYCFFSTRNCDDSLHFQKKDTLKGKGKGKKTKSLTGNQISAAATQQSLFWGSILAVRPPLEQESTLVSHAGHLSPKSSKSSASLKLPRLNGPSSPTSPVARALPLLGESASAPNLRAMATPIHPFSDAQEWLKGNVVGGGSDGSCQKVV